MSEVFDAYQLRARVHPVLLAALPAAVVAYAVGIPEQTIGRLGTAAVTFGVASLLVAMARDRGQRLERRLWNSWGGPPTTTMMMSTSAAPSPALEAHRAQVRRLLPHAEPLTDESDRESADASRLTIERYTAHLRERTRDRSQFPVVFDANVGYGFRRNVLGLRAFGLAVSVGAMMVATVALVLAVTDTISRPLAPLLVAGALGAVAAAFWRSASPSWVREQAERYAGSLLDAAEALEPHAGTRQSR